MTAPSVNLIHGIPFVECEFLEPGKMYVLDRRAFELFYGEPGDLPKDKMERIRKLAEEGRALVVTNLKVEP